MLQQGIFDRFKPEAVFGLHVFSTPQRRAAAPQRPVHGGVGPLQHRGEGSPDPRLAPWGGVDPIVAAADIIGKQPDHRQPPAEHLQAAVVVSYGAIKGGIRYNLIPDSVELVGTIRTFDEGMRRPCSPT